MTMQIDERKPPQDDSQTVWQSKPRAQFIYYTTFIT